ncbi:hypothetical protein Tco_0898693 [Tanacetum coccineum]|uniref:DUF4283 domain-containing protein n=1 Tax=Tanacetum coccineum TaxID=301880 RepID=A0ABQ5H7E9_9ASTR
MDQVESVKTSKALKEIFLEFKDVSHDFIPDERCVWIDLVGLPLASWAPEVYKKLVGSGGEASVCTDMVSDGPMSHGSFVSLTICILGANIESMEVNSESNPLERKDAEGFLVLDEIGFCERRMIRLQGKEFEDDAGENSWSSFSRVIVVNVTIDDKAMLTPVLLLKKTPSFALPSTNPRNDSNIAARV